MTIFIYEREDNMRIVNRVSAFSYTPLMLLLKFYVPFLSLKVLYCAFNLTKIHRSGHAQLPQVWICDLHITHFNKVKGSKRSRSGLPKFVLFRFICLFSICMFVCRYICVSVSACLSVCEAKQTKCAKQLSIWSSSKRQETSTRTLE